MQQILENPGIRDMSCGGFFSYLVRRWEGNNPIINNVDSLSDQIDMSKRSVHSYRMGNRTPTIETAEKILPILGKVALVDFARRYCFMAGGVFVDESDIGNGNKTDLTELSEVVFRFGKLLEYQKKAIRDNEYTESEISMIRDAVWYLIEGLESFIYTISMAL